MTKDQLRQILVTSALPYANGPIHIGHLVEYIQTDIWVRFHKMQGHLCYYICADDAHGTPIMLRAEKEGIEAEQMIARIKQEHEADFKAFMIDFDIYHSTHSTENQHLINDIYHRLKTKGYIYKQTIRQAYDEVKGMFLPDRFIQGNCPKCDAAKQYGDSCEVCGVTYSPTELKNPVSVLSNTPPIQKESEHDFFSLGDFHDFLYEWVHTQGHVQKEVINKLEEWFSAGLKAWDISRDAPYFGFKIPDSKDQYFYVWLDAPIGYLASFKALCQRDKIDYDHWFLTASTTELYHFIGKDIIYFHTLFWPAILHASDYRTPTAIFAHGFLTVNGQKMSKSRGTFIEAKTWIAHLDPECLRYYFASKLTAGVEDIDLNFEDFRQRVNADLVGKVINISSRCAKFINQSFDNKLADTLHDPALWQTIDEASDDIAKAYEQRHYATAMRNIMSLADTVNQYIETHKPWELAKKPDAKDTLHSVCSMGINAFKQLIICLKPVLPSLAVQVEQFLNCSPFTWADLKQPLLNHKINTFETLMLRIQQQDIDNMITESQDTIQNTILQTEPIAEQINIENFMSVDLRVAKIIAADYVEGADKLLQLTVDLGGETRNIFAGIKSAYEPSQLVGRLTVVVANLKPRKMRFGLSEGMVLAAGDGQDIFILSPDEGAKVGMRIK